MTEEIQLGALSVTPDVLSQIASLSATEVDGVASGDGGGFKDLISVGTPKGAVVAMGEDGKLTACVHIRVLYGNPLREVAKRVQVAVADALQGMTGQSVASVDVFVDAIVFPG